MSGGGHCLTQLLIDNDKRHCVAIDWERASSDLLARVRGGHTGHPATWQLSKPLSTCAHARVAAFQANEHMRTCTCVMLVVRRPAGCALLVHRWCALLLSTQVVRAAFVHRWCGPWAEKAHGIAYRGGYWGYCVLRARHAAWLGQMNYYYYY